MKTISWCLAVMIAAAAAAGAQERSMRQDSSLDNLRHPPGTATTPFGALGAVHRHGDGPRPMVLIPGMGFGAGIWSGFMQRHAADYRMLAVTLPGFAGSPPLPMPDSGSYGEAPWIRSSVRAIVALLDQERIARATIVAHWALASQIALRLALDHPDRVETVVLVGGVLRNYSARWPQTATWTPQQRATFADNMGRRWFRTVTRQTWDDNNFMPYDYAVNPRRGLFLWREAQSPALPVWIRYLSEFNATDYSAELGRLVVPVLVVQPGFDDAAYYVEDGANYMRDLTIESWASAGTGTPRLEFVTIPGSRLFVMYDQPEALDRVIARFLTSPRR